MKSTPPTFNQAVTRRMSYALRVYQGKELVAVFTDVFGFWDESIKIVKNFVEPAANTTWITTEEWMAQQEGGGILAQSAKRAPQMGILKV